MLNIHLYGILFPIEIASMISPIPSVTTVTVALCPNPWELLAAR